jgi:hypothetical protein
MITVAAQQQDRRQGGARRDLAQVGCDMLVVLAQQGELAGPQMSLALRCVTSSVAADSFRRPSAARLADMISDR